MEVMDKLNHQLFIFRANCPEHLKGSLDFALRRFQQTALYIATRTIKRQDKEMRELNADINRHFATTLHPRATYMATTNETCGFAYVIREATIDGHNFTTLIKVFTDEDPDFNRREAEDLAKHLNEK